MVRYSVRMTVRSGDGVHSVAVATQNFCRNPRRRRNDIAGRRLRGLGEVPFRIIGSSTPTVLVRQEFIATTGRQLYRGDGWAPQRREIGASMIALAEMDTTITPF